MSTVITDNLTGKTSAGNVTITSEGGSATMQLQQGVAKAWATLDADASTVTAFDSFNVTSVQDDAAGKYGITYTNNMNNANYMASSSVSYFAQTNDYDRYIASSYTGGAIDARRTSSATKFGSYDANYVDTYVAGNCIHGDLA